jgi:uncharacterized protein involved in exopolysaccharide biosynthesis
VARATYTIPVPGGQPRQETLSQHYGSEDAAVGSLAGAVGTSITPKTGSVAVTVMSSSPELAQQITEHLLEELNEFNKRRRQSRAVAERQFLQARMAEADAELKQAELVLTDFYTKNRGFDRSPILRFDEARLAREATRRQQIYASLAQAFEQAKIDEVRDTPVITVIEQPRASRGPSASNRSRRLAIAALLGVFAALGLAGLLEVLRGYERRPMPETAELSVLRREALADLRNPTRVVRRLWS